MDSSYRGSSCFKAVDTDVPVKENKTTKLNLTNSETEKKSPLQLGQTISF